MNAATRWHGRALTAEALLLILASRLLVRTVAFSAWRGLLGRPSASIAPARSGSAPPALARRCANAVARASARLGGDVRCLPLAMALQWMLRRRGMAPLLCLGVAPGQARGGLDDLHAWVVLDGATMIGESVIAHHPVLVIDGGTVSP